MTMSSRKKRKTVKIDDMFHTHTECADSSESFVIDSRQDNNVFNVINAFFLIISMLTKQL